MATPKNGKTPTPRKYHVVLTDGTERTLTADDAYSRDTGALVLVNASGAAKVMYAPGRWHYVELETQDE